ncbi:MAG: hypothetical protein ACRC2H_10180 [Silanimonas sp.]
MQRSLLAFAAAYAGSVFLAGFVLGVLRTLWLAPAVGPLAAVLLELPLMLGLSWWVCGRLLTRWPLLPGAAFVAGALALVLLLVAELGVSMLFAGRDLAGHLAQYRLPEAQFGLAAQVLFGAMPWLRAREKRTITT